MNCLAKLLPVLAPPFGTNPNESPLVHTLGCLIKEEVNLLRFLGQSVYNEQIEKGLCTMGGNGKSVVIGHPTDHYLTNSDFSDNLETGQYFHELFARVADKEGDCEGELLSAVVKEAQSSSITPRYDFEKGHRGLISSLLYVHLRAIRPDIIIVQGSYVQGVFERNILENLPHGLGLNVMDGIDAIRSLSDKLNDPQMESLANGWKNPHFAQKVGDLNMIQTMTIFVSFSLIMARHNNNHPAKISAKEGGSFFK
jgi:hypothetical protein